MKRMIFVFCLVFSLLCLPLTGLAATDGDKAQQYEDDISDNWKKVLKNSIALDTLSAENTGSLLKWLDVENASSDAKKYVEKIDALTDELGKKKDSMKPYIQAMDACEEKLNADGANTAMENVILIQEKMLKDAEEIKALWKKVDDTLKK